MVERTVTVVNPSGIHARPATMVVDYVRDYPGKVEVIRDKKIANLKSILMVLGMGLKKGTLITLRVEGENEEEFIASLVDFILNLED